MNLSNRSIVLLATLTLAAAVTAAPPALAQQGPPPDNGGGMGGGPGGGDMGPGGGRGGPPDPAEMQQRLVRSLKRKLDVNAATFATLRPEIEKIVQLEAALESTSRPDRPARPREGDDNGPPDRQGGGGNDPQNGGGGGGGGNDANNGGGGGGNGGRRQVGGQNNAPNNAPNNAARDGGTAADADQDPTAADLMEKVRTLRSAVAPANGRDGDDGATPATDAELSADVKAVRAAATKAVGELAAARDALRAKVKLPRQEAVLVAAGVLD